MIKWLTGLFGRNPLPTGHGRRFQREDRTYHRRVRHIAILQQLIDQTRDGVVEWEPVVPTAAPTGTPYRVTRVYSTTFQSSRGSFHLLLLTGLSRRSDSLWEAMVVDRYLSGNECPPAALVVDDQVGDIIDSADSLLVMLRDLVVKN